jgi:hypothetical protein
MVIYVSTRPAERRENGPFALNLGQMVQAVFLPPPDEMEENAGRLRRKFSFPVGFDGHGSDC